MYGYWNAWITTLNTPMIDHVLILAYKYLCKYDFNKQKTLKIDKIKEKSVVGQFILELWITIDPHPKNYDDSTCKDITFKSKNINIKKMVVKFIDIL